MNKGSAVDRPWQYGVVREGKCGCSQGTGKVQRTRWVIWARSRLKMKDLSFNTDSSISVFLSVSEQSPWLGRAGVYR